MAAKGGLVGDGMKRRTYLACATLLLALGAQGVTGFAGADAQAHRAAQGRWELQKHKTGATSAKSARLRARHAEPTRKPLLTTLFLALLLGSAEALKVLEATGSAPVPGERPPAEVATSAPGVSACGPALATVPGFPGPSIPMPVLERHGQDMAVFVDKVKGARDAAYRDHRFFGKSAITCWDQVPDYQKLGVAIEDLYSDLQPIGAGAESRLFSARLVSDRPAAGLKRGDRIALRLKYAAPDLWGSRSPLLPHARSFRLGSRGDGARVTEYYPELYGFYRARGPRGSDSSPGATEARAFEVVEMEYVDTDLERFCRDREKLPDSWLFEYALGEAAQVRLMKLHVQDPDGPVWRNIGVKKVSHWRAYHIGSDVFLFEPGFVPRKIDLDEHCDLADTGEHSCASPWMADSYNLADSAASIGRDAWENDLPWRLAATLDSRSDNLLDVLREGFAHCKVSPSRPIPTGPETEVRHFHLDLEAWWRARPAPARTPLP